MIVTFCGHSQIGNPEKVQKDLEDAIHSVLSQGATRFYLGGYGEFDHLAAKVLYRLKSTHPEIESVLVLPYLEMKADSVFYSRTCYPPIERVPRRFSIAHRNRWMVDASDIVIAYVQHDWGGAYQTLSYAEHKRKPIILLGNSRLTYTDPA